MSSIKKLTSKEVSKSTGSSISVDETVYVIPDEKRLGIDFFHGGFEYCTKQCRCELVLREPGGDTLLACGYGQDFNIRVKSDFVGDGVNAVVIRFVNGDSQTLHMTGGWYGDLYG